MSDLVELTIDGKKVSVPKGTLLVEAAKTVGIEIPVFCYHEKLKPVGACRMCLVEIEKMPRLQTACTTPVGPGMVVNTKTKGAVDGQQSVLELLLANHPLDCPICDKGGECPLQDNSFKSGGTTSRLAEPKRAKEKALPLSDTIVLDRERCILCYRCTRFQEEIPGDSAIVPLERGGESVIGTLTGESFDSPFSGNTVELCPVGALTSRQYRFRSRPWDLQHVPSVCSGCSVGCNVRLDVRDATILRVLARENKAIDDGWLCDTGRYQSLPPAITAAHAGPEGKNRRVRSPMVRVNGTLQKATFADAIARAAALLRSGKSAIALSARLTDEACQVAGAALRGAFPNTAIGFIEPVVSPWPVQGRIQNLAKVKRIVDLGCDPWHTLPILALWLRKATTAGAPLVVVGPDNGLWRDSKHWLKVGNDGLVAAAEALAAALAGKPATPEATAAAAALKGDGPAAVLLGAPFAGNARLRAAADAIAQALGVTAETGFRGAPLRAFNARGAANHAPELARTDVLAGSPQVVCSIGCDAPVVVPGGKAIVVTSGAVPDSAEVEVVLPLAHPYETTGHVTNLDGQRQALQAAGQRPADVRMDHELLQALANAAAVPAGGRA
ncbi:MAG: (2Fe-2S)-binding protein [Planctomycetes bacterium]|nr:(2Fe-2S)-binding protein [Planctomycetota bacterium]